jgi:hypothetical protein
LSLLATPPWQPQRSTNAVHQLGILGREIDKLRNISPKGAAELCKIRRSILM